MSYTVLLDELFKCIDKIGYSKTLDSLQKAQFEKIKFSDKRAEFVVKLVAEKTKVPPFEIMYGLGRKNDRRVAIGLCAYYLHYPEWFNIDIELVTQFLNKSPVLCYKYSRQVCKLNPAHSSDKKYIQIKDDCDKEIRKEIKKFKK